jgi:hypothetical protein
MTKERNSPKNALDNGSEAGETETDEGSSMFSNQRLAKMAVGRIPLRKINYLLNTLGTNL